MKVDLTKRQNTLEKIAEKLEPLGFKLENGRFYCVPVGEYFDFSAHDPETVVYWACKTVFYQGVEVGEARKMEEVRKSLGL